MPRFDFRCLSCETTFEETLPFGSKTLPTCPACGKKKVEKLLSAPGIVFKGEGFYKTDSRPQPKKEEPAKETPKDPPKTDTKKPA